MSNYNYNRLQELIAKGLLWSGEREPRRGAAGDSGFQSAFDPQKIFQKNGAIHELALDETVGVKLSPPLVFIATVLRPTLEKKFLSGKRLLIWIGERSWPTTHLLNELGEGLKWRWRENVIFIETHSKSERLYAFRKCLTSPSVVAVVGDAAGFSLTATRQLQCAAHQGGSVGFLVRPLKELDLTSCAETKWKVKAHFSPATKRIIFSSPLEWQLTLLRARGLVAPKSWVATVKSFDEFQLQPFVEKTESSFVKAVQAII